MRHKVPRETPAEPTLKIVSLTTPHQEANEGVVEALEYMLELARQGNIEQLLVVGVDPRTRTNYRTWSPALDIQLLGAVHQALFAMHQKMSTLQTYTVDPIA